MSELKKCPFCGNSPRIKNGLNSEDKPFYQVTHDCMNLLSQIKTFCCETEPEAIAAWNRRAQPENARAHARETGICPMCEDCPDGCPVETPNDSRNRPENEPLVRCGECECYLSLTGKCYCGEYNTPYVNENHFCGYGRRKPERSEG